MGAVKPGDLRFDVFRNIHTDKVQHRRLGEIDILRRTIDPHSGRAAVHSEDRHMRSVVFAVEE